MLFILAVIHMSELGSPVPDRYEALHAYATLEECWDAAYIEHEQREPGEAVIVCLPEEV